MAASFWSCCRSADVLSNPRRESVSAVAINGESARSWSTVAATRARMAANRLVPWDSGSMSKVSSHLIRRPSVRNRSTGSESGCAKMTSLVTLRKVSRTDVFPVPRSPSMKAIWLRRSGSSRGSASCARAEPGRASSESSASSIQLDTSSTARFCRWLSKFQSSGSASGRRRLPRVFAGPVIVASNHFTRWHYRCALVLFAVGSLQSTQLARKNL